MAIPKFQLRLLVPLSSKKPQVDKNLESTEERQDSHKSPELPIEEVAYPQ